MKRHGVVPPRSVVVIGASTGGPTALEQVLLGLPAHAPGIVIVQHMGAKYTRAFAERLDSACLIGVREAEDGSPVRPGQALVAAGDRHLRIVRQADDYVVRVSCDEPVNGHRPSVDVLFDSCAQQIGANAVGVILTGMGNDGARGMLAMHKAGARTFAQDEATCVVFGMPREAILAGGAEQTLGLQDLPQAVLRTVSES